MNAKKQKENWLVFWKIVNSQISNKTLMPLKLFETHEKIMADPSW